MGTQAIIQNKDPQLHLSLSRITGVFKVISEPAAAAKIASLMLSALRWGKDWRGLASTKPLKPQDPPSCSTLLLPFLLPLPLVKLHRRIKCQLCTRLTTIQPSSCQSGRKKFSRTIGLSPEPRATLHCRGVHKGSRMEEESLCVWSQPQALHHHHCRLHTWKPFHILPLLQDALHRLYFRA